MGLGYTKSKGKTKMRRQSRKSITVLVLSSWRATGEDGGESFSKELADELNRETCRKQQEKG